MSKNSQELKAPGPPQQHFGYIMYKKAQCPNPYVPSLGAGSETKKKEKGRAADWRRAGLQFGRGGVFD